jgi:hypothetical protein
MTFQYWIPIVAAILIIVAYFAYRRTTPQLSARIRLILTALRTAAFLCLVLILLDPRCVRTVGQEETAKVIALVDVSASMALSAGEWDAPDPVSRFDQAVELSRELDTAVEAAGGELETVYFSNGLTPATADSLRPDGQGTDIIRSLNDALRRREGSHITAVVLFSDGVETEERLVRPPLPDTPVFAVGLGDTTPPEDVLIRDVDYNSVVRVPSRSPIRATVGYTGGREKRATVKLTEGAGVIYERRIDPFARAERDRLRYSGQLPRRQTPAVRVDGRGRRIRRRAGEQPPRYRGRSREGKGHGSDRRPPTGMGVPFSVGPVEA